MTDEFEPVTFLNYTLVKVPHSLVNHLWEVREQGPDHLVVVGTVRFDEPRQQYWGIQGVANNTVHVSDPRSAFADVVKLHQAAKNNPAVEAVYQVARAAWDKHAELYAEAKRQYEKADMEGHDPGEARRGFAASQRFNGALTALAHALAAVGADVLDNGGPSLDKAQKLLHAWIKRNPGG